MSTTGLKILLLCITSAVLDIIRNSVVLNVVWTMRALNFPNLLKA